MSRTGEQVNAEPLTVEAFGVRYQMWDHTSKIAGPLRKGIPYELPLLRLIASLGLSGMAVDAGAHIGNHTVFLAAVCGLQVTAFEPVEYDDLFANVTVNHLTDQVTIHPVALGSAEETATHEGRGRLGPGGDIPVRTLDSYELTNVSLVKVDVEGMGSDVLRGGEITIRRDRPVIFAEEHDQAEHDEVAAVLEPWGYAMTRRLHAKGQATPMGRWDAT